MTKDKANKTTQGDKPSAEVGVSLQEKQVWRKRGQLDWLRVKHIMLLETSRDDGGLPGVTFELLGRNGKGKKEIRMFLPAKTENAVINWLKNSGRYLAG